MCISRKITLDTALELCYLTLRSTHTRIETMFEPLYPQPCKKGFSVKRVDKATANRWIAEKHYRRTLGIFWEGFALVENGYIVGIVTYGQPSPSIQKYAFVDRDFRLYELTRLVVQTETRNAASYLISHSVKMLREHPCAIVSYADGAQSHCGIVYQATNWHYTGEVVAHDKFYIVDGEKLHSKTVQDRFGVSAPTKWAKENGIEMVKPSGKFRYFLFIGSKSDKRKIRKALKYPILPDYPKTDQRRYDTGKIIVEKA